MWQSTTTVNGLTGFQIGSSNNSQFNWLASGDYMEILTKGIRGTSASSRKAAWLNTNGAYNSYISGGINDSGGLLTSERVSFHMKRFAIEMTTEQTRELIKTIDYRLANDKSQSFESTAYLQRIQHKIWLAMKEQAKKDNAETVELA